jgi:hypothetical protein
MLSGKKAFKRDTTAETLTAILKDEPPQLWASGGNIPVALDRVVRHCLEKNAEDGFQSAKDVAFELSKAALSVGTGDARAISTTVATKGFVAAVVGAAAVLVVAGIVLLRKSPGALVPCPARSAWVSFPSKTSARPTMTTSLTGSPKSGREMERRSSGFADADVEDERTEPGRLL